ncbi:hypothetical protein ACCUM_4432 [Candidatus Accumulibacter phosphatis]|uniref:Uncharacterized protein n=1 Tax=Candidatus Accumulibacter phosphatis TaxID=327160 RepID=A0A5S4ELS6_9PROT|nr:hypothetical protein ACCUM_4432 [Candidatus Accumulibacter phosphatis]
MCKTAAGVKEYRWARSLIACWPVEERARIETVPSDGRRVEL